MNNLAHEVLDEFVRQHGLSVMSHPFPRFHATSLTVLPTNHQFPMATLGDQTGKAQLVCQAYLGSFEQLASVCLAASLLPLLHDKHGHYIIGPDLMITDLGPIGDERRDKGLSVVLENGARRNYGRPYPPPGQIYESAERNFLAQYEVCCRKPLPAWYHSEEAITRSPRDRLSTLIWTERSDR